MLLPLLWVSIAQRWRELPSLLVFLFGPCSGKITARIESTRLRIVLSPPSANHTLFY